MRIQPDGRMGGWLAAAVVGVLSLHPVIRLSAQSLQTMTSSRLLRGEDTIAVRVEFGGGRFTLTPSADNVLYRARLEYLEGRVRPRFEYDRENRSLLVGIGGIRGQRRSSRVNFDFDNGPPQRLDLQLSPSVITDLSLTLGAVQTDVDLGGLALSRVELKGGASETTVGFSRPNRATCQNLRVMVGAGEFVLRQLGNAGCRTVTFHGGVGDIQVDLTGRWPGDAQVDIKMALGDLEIILPDNVGVEIQLDKLLASFQSSGPLVTAGRSNLWRTTNWDGSSTKLRVNVGAAFGSIRVRFADSEARVVR
jgi:hypothetical protein